MIQRISPNLPIAVLIGLSLLGAPIASADDFGGDEFEHHLTVEQIAQIKADQEEAKEKQTEGRGRGARQERANVLQESCDRHGVDKAQYLRESARAKPLDA